MNNHLAPTYQSQFGDYWVLWFAQSNNYSIVEHNFKQLLDVYFIASSTDDFSSRLNEANPSLPLNDISIQLKAYLDQCHWQEDSIEAFTPEFSSAHRHIKRLYGINDNLIQINYDSELVEKTLHPSIAHLEQFKNIKPSAVFDIYLEDNLLCLFKDEVLVTAIPKRNYHLLQGKFVMQLLSLIHHKEEEAWLGTFHGSTMSDGKNAVLFVGNSGKGKSTLCALLSANGFELVADDVSPMLYEDRQIYYNPSAISIKEGAFEILQPLIDGFEQIPETLFNTSKGKLKYVPCKAPSNISHPCKSIIMVNYEKGAETQLKPISEKLLLETLIPESWLSPNPLYAEQFLEWLKSVYFYKLTYSDTKSVVQTVQSHFKGLGKD